MIGFYWQHMGNNRISACLKRRSATFPQFVWCLSAWKEKIYFLGNFTFIHPTSSEIDFLRSTKTNIMPLNGTVLCSYHENDRSGVFACSHNNHSEIKSCHFIAKRATSINLIILINQFTVQMNYVRPGIILTSDQP